MSTKPTKPQWVNLLRYAASTSPSGAASLSLIIGKSGSGKSTLINMITGIDRPTSGEIYVGDSASSHTQRGPDGGLARAQHRHHLPVLPAAADVAHDIENVMLPMDFCNMYKPT